MSHLLTPEQELLLSCLRWGAEERAGAIRTALRRAPRGDVMAALARAHGLVPLVADALVRGELDRQAIDPQGEIAAEARGIGYRTVLLVGELTRLLQRLDEGGVSALPLKGPTLAAAAYGAPTLRPSVDLDLLVKPDQYAAARAVLVDAGYRPRRDAWSAVRFLSHESTFDGRDGRVEVDLHRRVFSRELPEIPWRELWARLDRVRLGETYVPVIRPEWLLVVLAEHAHKHLWARLLWIADLAHLIGRTPDLDWDDLFANARRVGGGRVLRAALLLARNLLSAPVPAPVVSGLEADASARSLSSEIAQRLFVERRDEDAARLELFGLQWRGRERWRDRLRFVLTPNEDDWMVLPLPAPLFPLYFAIRPFRLAAKYSAHLARRRSASSARR